MGTDNRELTRVHSLDSLYSEDERSRADSVLAHNETAVSHYSGERQQKQMVNNVDDCRSLSNDSDSGIYTRTDENGVQTHTASEYRDGETYFADSTETQNGDQKGRTMNIIGDKASHSCENYENITNTNDRDRSILYGNADTRIPDAKTDEGAMDLKGDHTKQRNEDSVQMDTRIIKGQNGNQVDIDNVSQEATLVKSDHGKQFGKQSVPQKSTDNKNDHGKPSDKENVPERKHSLYRTDSHGSDCNHDDHGNHDNNEGEQCQGHDTEPGQKRVGWLMNHETTTSSASLGDEHSPGDQAGTEIMAGHSSVDTAGQLHTSRSEERTVAGKGDKGVKGHENEGITAQEGKCITDHGLNALEKDRPNALENKTSTETEQKRTYLETIHEDASANAESCVSHRLSGRRPLSASGALTRTRRLLDSNNGAIQKEGASRPSSAKPRVTFEQRRFSLPVNLERSTKSNRQQQQSQQEQQQQQQQQKQPLYNDVSSVKQLNGSSKSAFIETSEKQATQETSTPRSDTTEPANKHPKATKARQRPQSSPAGRQTSSRQRNGVRPPSRPSTAMGPPKSWEMKFTKEELRRALPRRNHFSCHTQALKEAGYEVEEENNRRRRRHFFFNHHPEISEVSACNQAGVTLVTPTINEPKDQDQDKEKEQENKENQQEHHGDALVETAVSLLTFSDRAKRRRSSVMPQQHIVECKPLQQYLTYVRDNPAEYRQMIAKTLHTPGSASGGHVTSQAATDPATIHLVQMGRAFQARHTGGEKADEVIRAAYALRPRSADPNRFAKLAREKSPLLPGLMSKRESTVAALSGGGAPTVGGSGQRGSKPGSEDHRHRQETETKPVPTEHVTEMEKRRQKAEEWTKTVTTDQLVRAKLHVLKELGHEEHELSKWWLAFRDCHYIRPKIY